MFSFFKRKDKQPGPMNSGMSSWALSEDDQLRDQVGEYTYDALEEMKVDVKRRKFIWVDGKAMGIAQVAQRLHQKKTSMPREYIEGSIVSWLEEAYMPDDITDGDMEEALQRRIEDWIEAHEERRSESNFS